MVRFGICVLVVIVVATAAWAADSKVVNVESMPPVVVKTVPGAGDTAVDPSLSEIRVTFSKDMMTDRMWSWVIVSGVPFPKIAGEVRFLDDKRTCVAPVKLERGKDYGIWFNSAKHNSFRDQGNRPAVPYLLMFRTGR
jgi:Bacterial Ig-like domain